MYHIKDDIRCQKTVALIMKAFDDFIRQNPSKITISDICNASTVSRSTFYRLFDTVDDVIVYKFDIFAKQFISNTIDTPPRDVIKEFCRFWEENFYFIEFIIDAQKENLFYKTHCDHIDFLNTVFSQRENPPLTEEYVSMLTSLVIGFFYSCKKKNGNLNYETLPDMIQQIHTMMN